LLPPPERLQIRSSARRESLSSQRQRTDAALADRVRRHVQGVAETAGFRRAEDGAEAPGLANVSYGRVEEAGADGAVGLDDARDPRGIAAIPREGAFAGDGREVGEEAGAELGGALRDES
jgi:hypothetical protein